MNDATLTPTDNGPYIVEGNIALLDAEGNHYRVNGTIALCRCGGSATKPFCDKSHKANGFTACERATRAADIGA